MKFKNLFIVFCVLLSLFANIDVCYADVFRFPSQFVNAMEDARKENLEFDEYIKKKANELGISEEEYEMYLWYNKYDETCYYNFDEAINGGFTYQEYEKYVQKDNIRLGLSIIGVSVFVIFWIFILVMVVKKIKRRKLVEVLDNKENANGLGVEK